MKLEITRDELSSICDAIDTTLVEYEDLILERSEDYSKEEIRAVKAKMRALEAFQPRLMKMVYGDVRPEGCDQYGNNLDHIPGGISYGKGEFKS